MAFPRQRLDRPTGGRSVPIGSRLVLAALAGLLALVLGACATDEASPAATPADAGGPTVTIEDMAYTPTTLTVAAGATVTWVWRDGPSPTTSRATASRARSPPRGPSATASTSPAPTTTCAPCTPT
jgi:plastocyanin